jgi:uncharacterized membrane protein HdeD (DUF308 family)
MLRATILGLMGVVTLLFPESLLSGMIYVIAGYALLNGALSVASFVADKNETKTPVNYLNLAGAALMIILGLFSIVYYRYLVRTLPVFFGALTMLEGAVYFVASLGARTKLKAVLILFAILIAIGGIILIIFTFGFGGLQTLSRIFGGLLLISCVYELIAYQAYRKIAKN